MFKQTQSLSNALHFKTDRNVHICTLSALILHLVANFSPQIDSATAIWCTTRKFWPSDAAFPSCHNLSVESRNGLNDISFKYDGKF